VNSLLELTACCLLKLNQGAQADALLSRARGDLDNGGRDYYLGVALAHQGKIADALRCLQQARHQPQYGAAAQQVLLALLKRQVEQQMAQRDWEGASVALSQALDLAPTDPNLQPPLAVLGPWIDLQANKRAEVAAAWEKVQQHDPHHARTTHALALLYFWWAQALEAQQQGQEAVAAWQGAIRNWVALAYMDDFWTSWQEERAQVYGQIPETAVQGLRRKLTEHLHRKLADYQNDYLTQQQDAEVRRVELLLLDLEAELKTAAALHDVVPLLGQRGKKVVLPLYCGVLMLTHLGHLEIAQNVLAVAEATLPNDASTEHLHWCLSPWAYPWILMQERRYEEAMARLEQELRQNAASHDGHDLLAIAALERGKQLAKSEKVSEALEVWKTGLGHVRARKKTGDEIQQTAEDTASKEATRLRSKGTQEDCEEAIRMLEKARTIIDSPRLRQNQAEIHGRLGVIIGNNEALPKIQRWERAIQHYEKALQLHPGDAFAKRNLAIVLTNRGIEYGNEQKWQQACTLMERALQHDETSKYVCESLSWVLGNLGVGKYNEGLASTYGREKKIEGVKLLDRALELDADNEHAKAQLQGILTQESWLLDHQRQFVRRS
jgi:tetratricopeptide (TPR) repeat protein